MIRAPRGERRRVDDRPQAATVRGDDDHPAIVFEDAPDLTHEALGLRRFFKAVNDQHAVETGVGNRPFMLRDKARGIRPALRPADDALPPGRQRKAGARAREKYEIGIGVAKTSDVEPGAVAPDFHKTAGNEVTRRAPQRRLVEIMKIENVCAHETSRPGDFAPGLCDCYAGGLNPTSMTPAPSARAS